MKQLLYILAIAALAAACTNEMEEEITWNLDKYPDQLVVEGSITNEVKNHSIWLTVTNSYFDTSEPNPVSNAIVTVSDGENVYTFSESETQHGRYVSDIAFSGEPLKEYKLNIQLENSINKQQVYEAVSEMPEGIDMDTIICELYEMPEFDFGEDVDDEDKDTVILGIYYYGKEPDNPNNYYMGRIFRNDIPCQATVKEALLFNDDYQNGGFSDYIFYIENINPDDRIRFEIFSIEKDYYNFILDMQQMDQSGSSYSMSGPPANAIGNVPNAMGYFLATYVSESQGIAVDMR